MYFFIGDEHYAHNRIIKYCNRPFKDYKEMDEVIIARNNEVVGDSDTVIHAGDFIPFKDYNSSTSCDAQSYISRLKGSHVFLRGSHDNWMKSLANRFHEIWEKNIDGHYLVVCHFAMHAWGRSHYNSWHLYGHSHHELNLPGKRHCISVENTDYYPLSFDQIKEIMAGKDDNPDFIKPEDRNSRR